MHQKDIAIIVTGHVTPSAPPMLTVERVHTPEASVWERRMRLKRELNSGLAHRAPKKLRVSRALHACACRHSTHFRFGHAACMWNRSAQRACMRQHALDDHACCDWNTTRMLIQIPFTVLAGTADCNAAANALTAS